MIGVAMFGSTVYLSQYFQIAHGMSPTHAGLMSIAMVGGLLVSSIGTGRIISRTGRWKRYLVGGMVLVVVGLGAAHHHRRRPPAWSGSACSWRCSASASAPPCRTSCSRCRTTPPSATWAPPARWSRSSARWAARSASRRSARCSATRSRRQRRRPGSPRSASSPAAGGSSTDPGHGHAAGAGARGLRGAFGDATGHVFLIAAPCALARAGRACCSSARCRCAPPSSARTSWSAPLPGPASGPSRRQIPRVPGKPAHPRRCNAGGVPVSSGAAGPGVSGHARPAVWAGTRSR